MNPLPRGMKVQKTISLTADTLTISNKMGNFSGWIRARLRQFDEGIDPVELDLQLQRSYLRYKTLRAAINSCFPHAEGFSADDVFARYNELMTQKTLEEFE